MASTSTGPVPLPTYTPEYAAESNVPKLMTVLTLFQAISLIFVALRIYCRVVLVKSPGVDDIVMALGFLFTLGGGWVPLLIMSFHGLGKHDITVQLDDLIIFNQANFWLSIFALLIGLGLVKVAIGLNLLRLSTNKWYKWSLWATIAFVIAYTFMACMTMFLHCDTVAGNWDYANATGCYSLDLYVKFGLINTSFNIFTDVLFAVFPIPIIWTLQMKRKLRIYLVVILSLGYFAVAMGIVKAYFQFNFLKMTDLMWSMEVQFWGFLQLNVAIIAACAASLKPLFTRILGLGSTRNYYNNAPGAGSGYGSRYGRGTRRGTRRLDDADGTVMGTRTGSHNNKDGITIDEFELEEHQQGEKKRRSGNKAADGSSGSTSTTFYKHSDEGGSGSGSEERILGVNTPSHAVVIGPDRSQVGHQGTGIGQPVVGGRNTGILKTTEVQVFVQ
ncbi:hypothetical protein C8A03DRAFT_34874 [Achaetomium macrosporum]|uniref:Rhodopsin domain-containing protein n=1 Tax=Achaetomium macrosporum TaxID=79813 RepID=A0AAN7HBA3_9PEZI|nr:hypothetical protein C8A03DRAFT_34874 [Achaetomium macrosporum]